MLSESTKKVLGLLLKERRKTLAPNKKSVYKKGVSIRVDTELTTKQRRLIWDLVQKGLLKRLLKGIQSYL